MTNRASEPHAEGRSIVQSDVGVKFIGVSWSCEASRCVGIESEGPWAERDAGKSP